jgi:F-type H+-transporting ATPase subunit b
MLSPCSPRPSRRPRRRGGAAHGEAATSGITKIIAGFRHQLAVHPRAGAEFLAVVAFILWKFAFKPVLATLDERQQKIASGLA